MKKAIDVIFGSRRRAPAVPPIRGEGPPGARAYAIGDVHGRADLLATLLDMIEADRRARPCQRDYIIFLGDLVDRGADSRGVIDLLLNRHDALPNPIFLMGNHEEMMLRVLSDEPELIGDWLRFGGYECAQSYGVEVGRLAMLSAVDAARSIAACVPAQHIALIASFVDSFRFGSYLFVHAGIRPGIALEDQTIADLRWIREPFLEGKAVHPFIVVHGHTISATPDERPNRIGIDTGAYATGVLTALCIEGTTRKYLATAAQ